MLPEEERRCPPTRAPTQRLHRIPTRTTKRLLARRKSIWRRRRKEVRCTCWSDTRIDETARMLEIDEKTCAAAAAYALAALTDTIHSSELSSWMETRRLV